MLKKFSFNDIDNPYLDFGREELGERLARAQRIVKNLNIPVLIIVDGWESSGKGYVIKDLVRELNPKSYKVNVFENPTLEEEGRPFLWRFWEKIPKKGDVAIFDRSFYFKLLNDLKVSEEEMEKSINDISVIEKQLLDDQAIILKFFLHQKEKTQQQRIDELKKDPYREFFISERDEQQYKNYDRYLTHFDKILKKSYFPFSKWHVISTEDKKAASKEVIGMSIDLIYEGIDRIMGMKNGGILSLRNYVDAERPLEKADLTQSLSDKEYDKRKDALQLEVEQLTFELYAKGIPTVVVFEGVDAAGKGGAIERLTRQMDPRGYEVITTSAPNETERQYHYLWRFYRDLPKKGNIKLFDRSWYGRVLVERVEGFATDREWERAYDEINQMEAQLHSFGTLVIKFFLYIDKEEQLERFKARQTEPDKVYKITDEDWRNRDKWDNYIAAMNEMLVRTSTPFAPWTVVEGMDKKYARIKALETFVEQAKKRLEEER